jgi:protoheme IX farnesyltransferase
MKHNQNKDITIAAAFRYLLLVTAILAFVLIVLGVMTRVTGSGAACPDWPVCSGEWTPLNLNSAFIPLLHRLLAAIFGLGLLSSLIYALLRYRKLVWVIWPLVFASILLAGQLLVGRWIALQGENSLLNIAHYALALGVLSLTVLSLVVSYSVHSPKGVRLQENYKSGPQLSFRSLFAKLSLWTLIAVLSLYISGAWVTASSAGAACQEWPLCSQLIFPIDYLGWVNLAHRLLTLSAAILLAALFIQSWRTQRSQTAILVSTTAATVLFFSQALMGVVEAAYDYPTYLIGLHTVTAAAVWVVLVVQVGLVGLAGRTEADERSEAQLWKDRDVKVLLVDYLMLTKPVVVALLLVTTFAGMVVAAESWPNLRLVAWTLLGGFLAAGGSGAINQYIDRYDDTKMQRTAKRPIPSGRLTPGEGLAFGVAATLLSFYVMVSQVNFLAALLTLAGIIYYVLLYSLLLKKTTVQNIVIGGGAGAIPPLVGWAAATGSLNVPSLFLFAVVFMWTPPHFWALALVRRNDYARAGVPMMPVVRGERETRWQILIYTIELVGLTLILPLFGLGGGIYFVAAIVLGTLLLYSAWQVWKVEGNKVAWKMYRHSSMYLAFLFLALVVDALL